MPGNLEVPDIFLFWVWFVLGITFYGQGWTTSHAPDTFPSLHSTIRRCLVRFLVWVVVHAGGGQGIHTKQGVSDTLLAYHSLYN